MYTISGLIHFLNYNGVFIHENTKLSIVSTRVSVRQEGLSITAKKTSVTSGKTYQVFQTVVFPVLVKKEPVLHQVNAWKAGRANGFLGPSGASYLKVFFM